MTHSAAGSVASSPIRRGWDRLLGRIRLTGRRARVKRNHGPGPEVEGLEGRQLLSLTSSAIAEVRNLGFAVPNQGVRVIVKNINSVFERVNPLFAHGLGTTPGQVVGKTDFQYYPADLASKYVADDQSVLLGRKPKRIVEDNLVHGERIAVVTVKEPILVKTGPAKGLEAGLLIVSWTRRA